MVLVGIISRNNRKFNNRILTVTNNPLTSLRYNLSSDDYHPHFLVYRSLTFADSGIATWATSCHDLLFAGIAINVAFLSCCTDSSKSYVFYFDSDDAGNLGIWAWGVSFWSCCLKIDDCLT